MYLVQRSIQYIIVVLVVSWIAAGTAIFLGLRLDGPGFTIFAMAYMFLPAICAIVLQLIHKETPFSDLGISFRLNWWWLVAIIVPIIFGFLTFVINLLFPNVSFSAAHESFFASLTPEQAQLAAQQLTRYSSPFVFVLLQILNALIFGCTINAIFAFGEELGWRGYLLRALQDKRMLPISLIVGAVWGLWHFPLILLGYNYPQHPAAGAAMMVVFCILLTPMMIYIVIKSKSMITAAIFHGVVNAVGGLPLMFLAGGNDLTNGITGLAGFIALLLLNIAFFLFDKYVSKEDVFTSRLTMFL